MLQYQTHADKGSLFNTPPAFNIYMCGLTFEWIKAQGGLAAMQARNEEKAKLFYDYLDESKLFRGTARSKDRSLMNAPFATGNADLDAQFVREAEAEGLVSLKGHRSVGGMRASMYNAMPMEGVEKLVAFMKAFEEAHREAILQMTETEEMTSSASEEIAEEKPAEIREAVEENKGSREETEERDTNV
jgi:phosphoserine aminotransferase